MIRDGKLEQGCTAARRRSELSQPREKKLAALRVWVGCLSRAGRLAEASAWLSGRSRGAPELYTEALMLIGRSPANLPRAVTLLDRASRLWPDNAELAYRAGLLLLTDDQPRPALKRLRRACRLRPEGACQVAVSHALLDLDQTDAALTAARQVVRLKPRRVDIARGRALMRRIARRREALPSVIRQRYRRALAELKRDRPSAAIAITQELLLEHPEAAPVLTLLGLAQLRQGNSVEAVVALQRAAQLEPGDATNHLYLAMIYESRNRTDRARVLYQRALRCDPFVKTTVVRLSGLLSRMGRRKETAALMDHLVALEGGSDKSLRRAGRAHLAAGSLQPAVDHFAQLLSHEPKDFEAHLRLAQAFLDLYAAAEGDDGTLLQRARHHAKQATAARPDDPELKKVNDRLRSNNRKSP